MKLVAFKKRDTIAKEKITLISANMHAMRIIFISKRLYYGTWVNVKNNKKRT